MAKTMTLEKVTLKGKLEFLTMFLPIKLFTEKGEIDLWKHFDKFFTSKKGKKVSMDMGMGNICIKENEASEYALEYKSESDTLLIVLNKIGDFGFSNIGAYLPDMLQRLNGRTIVVEIDDEQIAIKEDPSEEVYGLYYTNGNCCHIPNDKVKEVCKIGKGGDTCIFCVASSKGFECAKFDSMASHILYRHSNNEMSAGRIGNCKILGRKD